jgi:hypothetical protein
VEAIEGPTRNWCDIGDSDKVLGREEGNEVRDYVVVLYISRNFVRETKTRLKLPLTHVVRHVRCTPPILWPMTILCLIFEP